MLKFFTVVAMIALPLITLGQESNSWTEYLSTEELKFSTQYADCNYPQKGVHNRYVLLRIENLSDNAVTIEYRLQRSYNGKELAVDLDVFQFEIPANSHIEAGCENLEKGLHIFAKMLGKGSKSVLSGFQVLNVSVNGKTIEQ